MKLCGDFGNAATGLASSSSLMRNAMHTPFLASPHIGDTRHIRVEPLFFCDGPFLDCCGLGFGLCRSLYQCKLKGLGEGRF